MSELKVGDEVELTYMNRLEKGKILRFYPADPKLNLARRPVVALYSGLNISAPEDALRATHEPQFYYRFDDRVNATFDTDGPYAGGHFLDLHRTVYAIKSKTPKGVWLRLGPGEVRFVLSSARTKFACPTEREALQSFIARKQAQAEIHKKTVARIEHSIAMANEILSRGEYAAKPGSV